MCLACLPNPFMPEPTAPTAESRRMVQRMLEALEPKVKPNSRTKRGKPQMRLAVKKR